MKLGLLILCLCLAMSVSLYVGPADMSVKQIFWALWGQGSERDILIVQNLRLPRTVLAACVGAGLAGSGAALQAYTRNPLADPGILGFSACAALGAVAALYWGLVSFVPAAALIGACLGAGLILLLSGRRKSVATLILAGIGIGSLATSLTGLLMNFAPNPWALSEIAYWLMGSLRNAELGQLLICAPLTLIGLVILTLLAPSLNVMGLGEETAQSLGVSLGQVRLMLVIGVSMLVGSGVAVAGAIGFVGLFIPHILRFIIGSDARQLIPFSAVGGAAFLVLADILTRFSSGAGSQLYLGILTSLIGVPFFLWLALREGRHD